MALFPWIIIICWAALMITWIITSFRVKRDINRSSWWWVRTIIIVIAVEVVLNEAGKGNVTYTHDFSSPVTGNIFLLALAAILCVLGIALSIWARLHLGRNWSPVPNIKEGHELVTSGPYKFIRHPIYTGIILAMLGSALISPMWFIICIIFTGMFIWRVGAEEKLMMQQFPDQYPEYKKKTWALIPYVW